MAKLSIPEEVAKAKAADVATFVSVNVHDCGTALRYTNSHGECVHCKLLKTKSKRDAMRKGQEKNLEHAIAAYGDGLSLQQASIEGRISNHSLRKVLEARGLLRDRYLGSESKRVGYDANETSESSAISLALSLMRPVVVN